MAAIQSGDAAAVPAAAAPIVAARPPMPLFVGGLDALLQTIANAVNIHTAGIANLVAQCEMNAAAIAKLEAQVANLVAQGANREVEGANFATNLAALALTMQNNHDAVMAATGATARLL
jgi:hypothetical protein